MLDIKNLLNLEKILDSIEINPDSTYPLSEPSVHCTYFYLPNILFIIEVNVILWSYGNFFTLLVP